MAETARAVLVIKLGALGDFILACGPFAAIRRHHRAAHITLLTTAPYAELARACGWFDAVWLDERPGWTRPLAWLTLRRRLIRGRFDRVYDLQTSDRSGWYFRLLPRRARPEWSGIARGCSHPHANPRRDLMHTVERQAEQLRMVGLEDLPPADLSWLDADISRFDLPDQFALLVPGGARRRPAKRWPADRYAALARRLAAAGIAPVLLGGEGEAALLGAIVEAAPAAIELGGETAIADIAALARRARLAVGNDTGPMHVAALCGCRSVVLFSRASDPALCAPRGREVAILRRESLAALAVEEVWAAVEPALTAA